MSLEPVKAEQPKDATSRFQERRLAQILYVALVGMAVSATLHGLQHNWRTVLILFSGAFFLLMALLFTKRGGVQLASSLMLVTFTVMMLTFAWVNQGPRDPAILALPGILVIASMMGGRRLYASLLGLMLLAIGVLVLANVEGWHQSIVKPIVLTSFIDISAILVAVGFCVWLLSNDLRRALVKLEIENEQVRLSESRIAYLAHHDSLTGLANRILAKERCDQTIALARRQGRVAAMLFLDLDNFKTINDSLGHEAGDELLCQAAQRLSKWVRSSDIVCRQGGDEFLVILGNMPDSNSVADVAVKLTGLLTEPYQVDGLEVTVTCSTGIALYPDDGPDFETLRQKADIAMYQAKESGRNVFRFFDCDMNSSVGEHLHLVSGMRQALLKDEFVLYYQPQFDIASGDIVGAEALIRWQHPEQGLVPPGKFIPVAEQSGLIIEIGAWVLQEACRQGVIWEREGLGELILSVNLSPVQFRRGDVETVVCNALDGSGLPPSHLDLEMTESLLIDDSTQLTELLARLRTRGLSFSIDDFGTGYSNLGYLKRFEVERLKIDQSFVKRLTEEKHDEAIVRAIIQMAHSLKLTTVAEGIEDAATLERLRDLGCDRGQGFYWSRPLPADEFLAFVRRYRAERPSEL
ncbi:putative bifunctional diguanylate cyclase/phosphodiesterase [Chitinimonas sp. PSY-7]